MYFKYFGPKPENLTADTILAWAKDEIEHFQWMIDEKRKNPNAPIRPEECIYYIKCWDNVQKNRGEWDYITPEAKTEVMDRYHEEMEE